MIVVCTYHLDKCEAFEVINVINNHPHVIIKGEGKWQLIENSEHRRTVEQIKRRLAYEKILTEISSDALKNRNLNSFINYSLRKLGKLTGVSRTYIFKIHNNDKKMSNTYEWVAEGTIPQIDNLQNVDCDMIPFWMKKLHKNEIINFHNIEDIPSLERDILKEQDIKSILIVPIYTQKKLYGFVGFDECKTHRKWETPDMELLRAASQIIVQKIERGKAEEKIKMLSDAVESSYDPILLLDLNGTIIYANKVTEKITGFKKEELIGKPWDKFNAESEVYEKIKSVILRSYWTGEINVNTKKEKIPFLLTASLIKNTENEPIAVICSLKCLSEIKKLEKEKEVLNKKVVEFTKQIPLTEKEKLVFYGLVKWPELNDLQLSKELKVKRSTVTAIKNKLRKGRFYSPFVIPNFYALGYELMSLVWGTNSIKKPLENELKTNPINEIVNLPESVLGVVTDKEFLGLLMVKNFTEFKRIEDWFVSAYKSHASKEENIHIAHFPFETTQISQMFDYGPLLKMRFNLNIKEKKEEVIKKPAQEKLTEREQIILYALTKWPELNDSEISKRIKVARQTTSKTKHRLMKQGMIKLINKPNLKKLGCDLLINLYYKFSQKNLNKRKEKEIREMKKIYPAVFRALSERESLSLSIFKNFIEYKKSYDKLLEYLKEKHISKEECSIFMIPIEQIKLEKMDFAPLLKKIFNLKL